MSQTLQTEKPRPQLAEGSARELLDVLVAVRRLAPAPPVRVGTVPPDQPVRRGHHGVDPGAANLRAASTIVETNAEDRLVLDSLSPVEGTAPPCRRTGTPLKGSINGPPFDPICPLFEHDRPDHDLTARTADRAVLIEVGRFLTVIFASGTPPRGHAERCTGHAGDIAPRSSPCAGSNCHEHDLEQRQHGERDPGAWPGDPVHGQDATADG